MLLPGLNIGKLDFVKVVFFSHYIGTVHAQHISVFVRFIIEGKFLE